MSESNKRFRVGLGVSGGIAAYKAIEVLRLLQKADCDVQVAMTRNATEFIQPLTFRALTEKYVLVDDYEPNNPDPIAHINFSQEIDLLLIVPTTANTIAKFANGIADDFLTSTYLASTAPVMVAPAMNVTMWEQPATQRNVDRLKADGVYFVEPISGELACKTVGTGKLEDVENIAEQALKLLGADITTIKKTLENVGNNGDAGLKVLPSDTIANIKPHITKTETYGLSGDDKVAISDILFVPTIEKDLIGEKVLITVGGTREAIDPVRFISNHSSGKMGFAIAEAAKERGAEVIVVAGKTTVSPPQDVDVVSGISAEEMFQETMKHLADSTVFIGAAAVADYRPKETVQSKIKKTNNDSLTLELERTADILANVSKNRHDDLIVVGFAAETNNVIEYAKSKKKKKDLDLVIANDITKKGAGFNSDTNIATIITDKHEFEMPLMTKRELADKILDEVLKIRKKPKTQKI